MANVKLTKNELKAQKDALKRFTRYLPTLELKKSLLAQEINRVRDKVAELEQRVAQLGDEVAPWVAVFADERVDLSPWCTVDAVRTGAAHIAGVDVPVFEGVDFAGDEIAPEDTPLWVDAGVETIRRGRALVEEAEVTRRQLELLETELQQTVQRIKMFEEVRIPTARRNIRDILIFLGDQQTAAVVRGKMAKRRLLRKRREAAS